MFQIAGFICLSLLVLILIFIGIKADKSDDNLKKRLQTEKAKWNMERLRSDIVFGWKQCYSITGKLPSAAEFNAYPELRKAFETELKKQPIVRIINNEQKSNKYGGKS